MYSHSEVGLLHDISLGVSQKACRGGCWPPIWGGASHQHGRMSATKMGGCRPPTVGGIDGPWREVSCVAKIEKACEVEDNTKKVKSIASCELPKEKSLAEYNLESGTQKYSKCQTPKNKLLLNEY